MEKKWLFLMCGIALFAGGAYAEVVKFNYLLAAKDNICFEQLLGEMITGIQCCAIICFQS